MNPNSPAGTPDLLAHGRDPWRPSRRQVVVTAAVLLVVGIGATVAALVVQRARVERAEREAVRALAFTFSGELFQGPTEEGSVQLELINTGPFGATVDDVRLEAPGFATVKVSEAISSFGLVTVAVPTTSPCDPRLYSIRPDNLLVRAHTARGTTVTVRTPFGRETAEEIWRRVRATCRFQLPEEALSGSIAASSLKGRTLTLRFELSNGAALPLVIDAVTTAADGLALSARGLPLTIPAGSGNYEIFGHRSLTLTLRVTDCAALRRAAANAGAEGLDGPNNLKVALHHRHAAGYGWLFLDQVVGPQVVVNHLAALAESCS